MRGGLPLGCPRGPRFPRWLPPVWIDVIRRQRLIQGIIRCSRLIRRVGRSPAACGWRLPRGGRLPYPGGPMKTVYQGFAAGSLGLLVGLLAGLALSPVVASLLGIVAAAAIVLLGLKPTDQA